MVNWLDSMDFRDLGAGVGDMKEKRTLVFLNWNAMEFSFLH